MTYPGSDMKFQVTTTQQDFQLSEDDFTILVKDQYSRVRQTITKNDCFYDTDGRFYFVIENVRRGIYHACFTGSYEDDDYDSQKRVFTDIQELYRVGYHGGSCCGGTAAHGGCQCEHKVQYQQVWTVSIDGEDYLADCYGRYITTSDGKRICFTSGTSQKIDNMGKVQMKMTGEEFLRKWESFDPNGEVDTIPELMHAMEGVSDDRTVREEVQQQIDADIEGQAADHNDIDDIFNG